MFAFDSSPKSKFVTSTLAVTSAEIQAHDTSNCFFEAVDFKSRCGILSLANINDTDPCSAEDPVNSNEVAIRRACQVRLTIGKSSPFLVSCTSLRASGIKYSKNCLITSSKQVRIASLPILFLFDEWLGIYKGSGFQQFRAMSD